MNEFVYVEFIFKVADAVKGGIQVGALGEDFISISGGMDWEQEDARGYSTGYYKMRGKINSAAATVVKLSNTFLSDHMHISYISDELKDKYRA